MTEEEYIKAENEKKREELAQAYKRWSMTDDGKIMLKDLERFCNANKTCVCEESPNALQTHYESGKRRVILRIHGFLRRKTND